MPIQAKIKFDTAGYGVTGYDENNGRDYVIYESDKILTSVDFNTGDAITILISSWDGAGLINITGRTQLGGGDVDKTVYVAEGETLHWPTFNKSAEFHAKVQTMIEEEIKKQMPAD